jgi:hypothetical protein
MHAPAFISLAPKHRFYKIVERFIRAEGDIAALTGVYNELFAEVFREQVAPTKTSTFAAKCLPDPSAASCRHVRSSCRPGRAAW